MKPQLQLSVLCEAVDAEPSGRYTLAGVLDQLALYAVPCTVRQLVLVNRWVGVRGEFAQECRLVGPDGEPVAGGTSARVSLPDATAPATAVETWRDVSFARTGVYGVEVRLDGALRGRFPVRVVQAESAPETGRGERLYA